MNFNVESLGIKEKVGNFFKFLPDTLSKTFVWLSLSYAIPIVNILVIGFMRDSFILDVNLSNVLIATNACFTSSLLAILYDKRKERIIIYNLSIVLLVLCTVLFTISIIQIEQGIKIFNDNLYTNGGLLFLSFGVLFGLIAKYDETEAESSLRAKRSRSTKKVNMRKKEIDI